MVRSLILAAFTALALLLVGAAPARAEYRAHELEVIDLYDCQLNKRKKCRTQIIRTAMDPAMYARTHGGENRVGVILLASWICYGDTSNYLEVCSRPMAINPRFNEGDKVKVALKKHVTQGWIGVVERSYYQPATRSNIYGVRFPDRRDVYARYYEKDLATEAGQAPQSEPPQ